MRRPPSPRGAAFAAGYDPRMVRILVVEDDPALCDAVTQAIGESGFPVDAARTGPEGLRLATSFDYGLIVLDLLLPGLHGLAVLREAKRAKPELPVLVLSALADVEERIDGLDHGADDYLAKPFALGELLARVRALLRRSAIRSPESVVRVADLEVDLARRSVRRRAQEVALTGREYGILLFLLARRGHPVTRQEIGDHVVDHDFSPASNAIDVSICGLRAKLGEPGLVRTVRGYGYVLDAPERP